MVYIKHFKKQLPRVINSIFIIIGRILKPETLRIPFDIKTIQIYKPFIVEFLPLLSLVDILSNQLFNQLSKQLNFMLLIMTLEELIAQNVLLKLINVNTFTLLCNVLDCTPNLKLMKSKDLVSYINIYTYI
ncbi:hypothetical protein K502DRAFT_189610 [Neoconidiobolus thromboides FSU 785]|nr:hypothetical protein K502DRAFT_189610 [Neoconidiobolus thromboides FSU 785]